MPPLTQSLSRRLDRQQNCRGLETWEPRPDPFDPEQTIEVYIPALEEMSQSDLERVVSKYVSGVFEGKEPTIETERVRYAVYRLGAFRSSRDGFVVRDFDSLIRDINAIIESCEVLAGFVELEHKRRMDSGEREAFMKFVDSYQLLVSKAGQTYVSATAQDSLHHPDGNWRLAPSSLPCWQDLAEMEAA